MKRYEIKHLQIWPNQMQILWLPDFSEIIDVSLNRSHYRLDVLCKCPEGADMKQFNFWISEVNQYSNFLSQPPYESYQFIDKVEVINSSVNLGLANSGKVEVENHNTSRLYIFIEEIKTIAENRDKQLEEIVPR